MLFCERFCEEINYPKENVQNIWRSLKWRRTNYKEVSCSKIP